MTLSIEIIWPDGKLTTGNTWRSVENKIMHKQRTKYHDRLDFRIDMAHRARVWTGDMSLIKRLKEYGTIAFGTSESFLRALAATGMMVLRTEVHDEKETI